MNKNEQLDLTEHQKDWKNIYTDYLGSKNWLDSLITDPAGNRYLISKSPQEYRLGEEESFARSRLLTDYLNRPQDAFSSIHVAGTGGKGSVTTMIDAILEDLGFTTGRHTSPYVQIPNEKLIVSGEMIKPSEFSNLIDYFKPKYEAFIAMHPNPKPTHGEVWIALTYEFFKNQKIDWAVIETGMGGRLDPTNTLNSEIAVITNVDYDHIPQLGKTIEEIAWHKAGIIKSGKPVVTAETKYEALSIIKREAEEKNSPIFIYGADYFTRNISHTNNGVVFDLETPFGSYNNVYVNMVGEFQAINAATAIMAVLVISQAKGINITEESIRSAMKRVEYPGRMEKLQDNPLVIIDGAHNPQKMKAAAKGLSDLFPHMNITLLIGMLKTKDAAETLKQILSIVNNVITTAPRVIGKPSFSAKEMAEMVKKISPTTPVKAEGEIQKAVEEGKILSENGLLFISGSIYMLGDIRNFWHPTEELLKKLEFGKT